MGFPLTPRSMTLDDLGLLWGQILLEFLHISHISEAIRDKRIMIDLYCQRRSCSPLCTFQRYIDCVDIASRYSARGRQTTVRWQKQVFIHTRLSRSYLALARLSCLLTQNRCELWYFCFEISLVSFLTVSHELERFFLPFLPFEAGYFSFSRFLILFWFLL